jgi:hypothetical protein
MPRFREFMRSWEDPLHPDNLAAVELYHTKYGNINSTGTLGDYRGYALSRWHPRFADSLEQGVMQLVLLLALRFRWVTYSSCQGHYYGGRRLASVERYVGMVPRSDSEQSAIRVVLGTVAAQVNRRHRFSGVHLEVVSQELETDGPSFPVIDLLFRRPWWATWKRYFSVLDSVYEKVVNILDSLPRLSEDNPCQRAQHYDPQM